MTTAITLHTTARTTTARRRWRRVHDAIASPPAAVKFTWANQRPGTPGFARWTAELGQRIEHDGLAANSGDLNNLIGVARKLGVAPIAVDVLADLTQPEPARCRAFSLVVSALTAERVVPGA